MSISTCHEQVGACILSKRDELSGARSLLLQDDLGAAFDPMSTRSTSGTGRLPRRRGHGARRTVQHSFKAGPR